MKKHSYNRFRKIINTAFNVRKWSDFDRMKEFTMYLEHGIKNLFIPQRQAAAQTFDEALQQYHINEATLLKKKKALIRLSLWMSFLAFGFFLYSIYLVVVGSFHAMLLSLVVMMFALVLAFRYHFWFFQIQQRKLGCTFQDWFWRGFLGRKD